MNDTHPQQHSKEEIGIPTFFAEDPRLGLSFDDTQLNPSLDQQCNKLNFHGRNSTISAEEKSFKDEDSEHIYVSIFSHLYLDLSKRSSFLI